MTRACVVLLVLAGAALGCPFCDGTPDDGNPVRDAVFGPDFWPTLLTLTLPFGVVAAVAAAIHGVPAGEGHS